MNTGNGNNIDHLRSFTNRVDRGPGQTLTALHPASTT